ncbi:MAG: hypothetical protein PHR07_09285 [Acidaminococcaceae bacterium]|nr:hypothetical protein [Acidaminococcaceae bacterium]
MPEVKHIHCIDCAKYTAEGAFDGKCGEWGTVRKAHQNIEGCPHYAPKTAYDDKLDAPVTFPVKPAFKYNDIAHTPGELVLEDEHVRIECVGKDTIKVKMKNGMMSHIYFMLNETQYKQKVKDWVKEHRPDIDI